VLTAGELGWTPAGVKTAEPPAALEIRALEGQTRGERWAMMRRRNTIDGF
jgi:hypothetical protein